MAARQHSVTAWLAQIAGLRFGMWILVSAWFLAEILSHPHSIGIGHDWAYFTHHATVSHLSWTVYHQVPTWNPYFCGGLPVPGNLQNNTWAPSFLFVLLFGVLPGMKIAFLAFFVAGMEGTYRYARHLGIRGAGAVAAALAFSLCGRFAQLFQDGQPVFLTFLLTPWALLCLERGFRSWAWVAAGALVMTVVFLEGGAVPLPFISILMFLWAVIHTIAGRFDPRGDVAWYRPLLALASMAALTALLSAFRLLPVIDTLAHNPREWSSTDTYSLLYILEMLFLRSEELWHQGVGSAYAGVVTVALGLVAVALRDRRVIIPAVCLVLLFDWVTGTSQFLNIFPLIKSLPVLGNIRNPYRATVFIALMLSLCAGCGIASLEHRLLDLARRLGGRRLAAGALRAVAFAVPSTLALLLLVDVAGHTRTCLDGVLNLRSALTLEQPFRQSVGNRWFAHVWPAAGLGSLSCFEEQAFFQSPRLRGDLGQEEYLADHRAGSVERVSWSPHRIELDVAIERPTTLVVNQNHHRGWHASAGRVASLDGLLAVHLPAGHHHLVLAFVDPLVVIGGIVSVLAILGLAAIGIVRIRARRAAAARSRPA